MSDESGSTRKEARAPVKLKIKFRSATLTQFIERYSVDVSKGGIFIRTKDPLEVGTKLRFEFQLQDGSPLIVGEGTVVWIREHDPSRKGVAPGMGVRFDKLQPESQEVLAEILNRKSGAPPVMSDEEVVKTAAAKSKPTPAPAVAAAVAAASAPVKASKSEPAPDKAPEPDKAKEPAKTEEAPKKADKTEPPKKEEKAEPSKKEDEAEPSKKEDEAEPSSKAAKSPKPAAKPAAAKRESARPAGGDRPVSAADAATRGEKGGGARILVIVLIIVLLGAGAYVLFTQVLGDQTKRGRGGQSGETAMGPITPTPDAEAMGADPASVDAAVPVMRPEPAMQPVPECTDGILTAVTSEPEGGKIFLDQKDTGQVTPGKICVPKNRSKKVVRIELDMYRPGYMYFRTVKGDKLNKIVLKLITYRIVIKTIPKRARVYVNDKYAGQTTLSIKLGVTDKVLKLKISKKNYADREITLDRATIKWRKQTRFSFIYAVASRLRKLYIPGGGAMDAMRPEPMRPEPMQVEPMRPEPMRVEPMRPEPMRVEPMRPEPMRVEPMRVEPMRPEPMRVEPMRPRPMRPRPRGMNPGWLKPP